jgi:excisionase family DNA binding protein
VEALLLHFEEAGAAIGVGRTTVYKLVRNGELQAVKIGRRRAITTASIREYVERLSEAGAQGGDAA